MDKFFSAYRRFLGFCLVGFTLLPITLFGQGYTSSAISGVVYGRGGTPAADVTVVVTHVPTQTSIETQSNSEGRYYVSGLRPGGPYEVTVEEVDGLAPKVRGIQLDLQRTSNVNLFYPSTGADTDEEPSFELEELTVTAAESVDYVFNSSNQGSGSVFDADSISALPTVTRSISDIARLDSRVAVFDRDSGAISAGGKNTRYNSLLIDGIPVNDTYGLSDNGLPSLNQPFSLEAIDQVSVQLSPYTVKYAGFTGASIAATTKSGTNEFHGSVYGFYRDESLVGDLYEYGSKTDLIEFENFTEYTYGASLGGPIIRDKLFFYALYENQTKSVVQAEAEFFPNQRDLDAIREVATAFQTRFDPGKVESSDDIFLEDRKLLLKLDWQIDDRHRLTARYNSTPGEEPKFPNSRNTAFSSNWYTREFELEDYSLELFSRWNSQWSSDIKVAYKFQGDTRNNNSDLPSVSIRSISGINDRDEPVSTTMYFGADQINELEVNSYNLQAEASYLTGQHKISFGVQYDLIDNFQIYLSAPYGSWGFEALPTYRNALGFENNGVGEIGQVTNFQVQTPSLDGTGAADWSMQIASAFVQDDWEIGRHLTLTYGVRMDMPLVDESPPEARGSFDGRTFEEVFGQPNTYTVDGNYALQPRFGFNYALDEDRTTQIRGGFGLFFGTQPHVWLANTYVENGASKVIYSTGTIEANDGTSPAFTLDVNEAVDYVRDTFGEAEASAVSVYYLDDDFHMPTEWKANLAMDRKLPGLDAVFSVEYQYSKVVHDVFYRNMNLALDMKNGFKGYLPDGRERYTNDGQPGNPDRWREAGYRDVIELTNTDKGFSQQWTASLRGSFFDLFDYRVAYTNTVAKSVNDADSPSAFTNWASNVAFNPNDDTLSTSNFEIRHRVVASLERSFKWNDRQSTSITLIYVGRSGRPYSYFYDNVDMNRDGISGNDLIYVPTGLDDPIVSWGSNNRDLEAAAVFMEFVNSTPGLAKYKGQVVPRNTGRAPFFNQFDLSLRHKIRLWGAHQIELFVNVQNIGNLLNEDWGLEKRPRGYSGRGVNIIAASHSRSALNRGDVSIGNEYGRYIYLPREQPITDDFLYTYPTGLTNRWAVQLGFRYGF